MNFRARLRQGRLKTVRTWWSNSIRAKPSVRKRVSCEWSLTCDRLAWEHVKWIDVAYTNALLLARQLENNIPILRLLYLHFTLLLFLLFIFISLPFQNAPPAPVRSATVTMNPGPTWRPPSTGRAPRWLWVDWSLIFDPSILIFDLCSVRRRWSSTWAPIPTRCTRARPLTARRRRSGRWE